MALIKAGDIIEFTDDFVDNSTAHGPLIKQAGRPYIATIKVIGTRSMSSIYAHAGWPYYLDVVLHGGTSGQTPLSIPAFYTAGGSWCYGNGFATPTWGVDFFWVRLPMDGDDDISLWPGSSSNVTSPGLYCSCSLPQLEQRYTGIASGGAWYKYCLRCKRERNS